MEQILNTVLLYSLALGLILALLTGLTLVLTRSASPLLRYRILVALLALFTASIVVTVFFKLRDTNSTTSAFNSLVTTPQETTDFRKAGTINTATTDLVALSRDFINDNARTITLIWLFIVFAKSIKLTSNLFELHYLKTRQVYPAGKHWEDQLAKLSGEMGLSKAVSIMQSGLTQVPLVIGHFKPLILIPLGMITAIKPREIEMMLLHELAHIKRMDFLVNFLQHVLELLFFFNPAVLWLSALIRKERENCCDELVLQNADEKHNYIQALLSFKEYQLKVPAYAMAFAKESNLVSRIKRMVYQKNTALNSIEKGCMLIAVLLLCSFTLMRTTDPAPKSVFQEPVVKKEKSQNNPATKPQKRTAVKSKVRPPVVKTSSPATLTKEAANPEGSVEPEISVNLNSNANNTAHVTVNLNHKLVENFASNVTTTVLSAINMALDSSQKYSSTLNAAPQTKLNPIASPNPKVKLSPLPKVEAKSSGLTQDLIKALEKAGIDTKGDQFRFHISNKELTVNGKKQTDAVKNAVLKNFLKSNEDTIDFSYNRNGEGVNTSSSYYRK